MSDATRPDPATVDTIAPQVFDAIVSIILGDQMPLDETGSTEPMVRAMGTASRLLSPAHAPTVAAAQAATPHGRQAMLTALGLNQSRHCRNCGWDVTVEP